MSPQPDQPPLPKRYLPGIRGLATVVASVALGSPSCTLGQLQPNATCAPAAPALPARRANRAPRHTPVHPGCPACCAGDTALQPRGLARSQGVGPARLPTAGRREGTLNPPWLHVSEQGHRRAVVD